MVEKLKQEIFRTEGFEKLQSHVAALDNDEPVVLHGVVGSLLAFVAAAIYDKASDISESTQVLLVVSDAETAATLRDDLELLIGSGGVRYFSNEHTHRAATLLAPVSVDQIEALRSLARNEKGVVVTHSLALVEKLPSPQSYTRSVVEVELTKELPFERFLEDLAKLGFEKKDFVEGYGDVAVRGGIVDVFPFVGENPIRLEFWGNTIESIREFDVLSQRSIKELQAVQIVPDLLSREGEAEPSDAHHSLIDYLVDDAIILMDNPVMIEREISESGSGSNGSLFTWEKIEKDIKRFRRILISQINNQVRDTRFQIDLGSTSQPSFNGSVDALYSNLQALAAQSYSIYLLCDTQPLADRLNELIEEVETRPETESKLYERKVRDETKISHSAAQLSAINYQLLTDTVHYGFILPSAHLAVYTEHEIFGRGRRRGDGKPRFHRGRSTRFRGFSLRELQSLKRRDYVVHADFGIGQFAGLEKIKVGDVEQEVMKVQYAEKDVLYVNLNYLNRVQKYSSKEGHVPKLSRLGTGEWDRLKDRAKRRIKDIARDLISLYAARKKETGLAFSPDTHWQKELEASFIYEDTPDQARATLEVKRDMEKDAPMDRLICGDVGFGKTEVAVRAAFKAVMDGQQAVLLVPTTILALQHHNTFLDRLGKYSVNVEMLSRFRSKKEQARILEDLLRGRVDIIIGTHRLLSKDVRFKDLGLLIIDEEHRFGVEAKEKLRKLRLNVDTLTLTATPIPRTLHFSLIGARDLSIINTPPRNRLPIITEISEFDVRLIRDAILKEVHRGGPAPTSSGQVYFVHDNVHRIDDMCTYLQEHIPEARFRVAHGQMRSTQLEKVMVDFLERNFDVLVCTKIIESGLDIPNVNTIIINRADRFGMAELYQLRGRVGRSNVQAYAYLLVPPISSLPKTTIRRLQAVEEFTELGSGFNLAMRDLEIRGTGNLLGAEQSGFIMEMGFEMYERVLEEAVEELKEEEFQALFQDALLQKREKPTETVIDTDLEAYLPDFYIESDTERLDLYRRLTRATTEGEIKSVREELKDRFGEYPEEVDHLLQLVHLRLVAARIGLPKIEVRGGILELTFPDSSKKEFFGEKDGSGSRFAQIIAKVSEMKKPRGELKEEGKLLKLKFELGIHTDGLKRIITAKRILDSLAS